MSIQNFVRDSSFFSNLRDRNRSISASDLDYQFASFENFLNNKISSEVDALEVGVIAGSTDEDDKNKFLKNVGDGNTSWSTMDFSFITKNSMPLVKIESGDEGSVLISNRDSEFDYVKAIGFDAPLISDIVDTSYFDYLESSNFAIDSITSEKIEVATIDGSLLDDDLIGNDLTDDTIETFHIFDNAVSGEKCIDSIINEELIGDDLKAFLKVNANIEDNSIDSDNFAQQSVSQPQFADLMFRGQIGGPNPFAPYKFSGSRPTSTPNLQMTFLREIFPLKSVSIPNGTASQGTGSGVLFDAFLFNELMADNSLEPRHFKDQSFDMGFFIASDKWLVTGGPISSRGYTEQSLKIRHLSPELKRLINLAP